MDAASLNRKTNAIAGISIQRGSCGIVQAHPQAIAVTLPFSTTSVARSGRRSRVAGMPGRPLRIVAMPPIFTSAARASGSLLPISAGKRRRCAAQPSADAAVGGDNDPAWLLGHSSVRHIALQRKNHAGALFRGSLFSWIVISVGLAPSSLCRKKVHQEGRSGQRHFLIHKTAQS